MSEPVGTEGLADIDTALDREVDVLSNVFRDVDRAEIARCVHETYAELERGAAVKSHLVALTRAKVSEKLRG